MAFLRFFGDDFQVQVERSSDAGAVQAGVETLHGKYHGDCVETQVGRYGHMVCIYNIYCIYIYIYL